MRNMKEKFDIYVYMFSPLGEETFNLKTQSMSSQPAVFVLFLLNKTKERQLGLTLAAVLQSEGG